MAKVKKRITARKAAQTFMMYAVAVGSALATVEIPEGELTDKAALTLGVATIAAVLRAVNNVRKTRRAPTRVNYVDYNRLTVVALVGLTAALAGCVTTTAPDGTVTRSVDVDVLSTAWSRYEAMQDRRAELERERQRADAQRRAEIEAELRRLEPEVRRLAEWLGAGAG